METLLTKLINLSSQKQIESFEVIGNCNKNGELVYNLATDVNFKEEAAYYVSLIDLSTTSFFPNITETNNKFYYYGPDKQEKIITLSTGAYNIKDYNNFINLPEVQITLLEATGKVNIKLVKDWVVDFTKPNTFCHELGFNEIILDKEVNISGKQADLLKTQKIFVSCDIIRGSYFKGKPSHILFGFNNSKRYGAPLAFTPEKRQYKLLAAKTFHTITFKFFDEDEKPIDFEGSQVTLAIEIRMV